jgi:N-acetylglucosamine-6-sulfatase
MTNSLYQNISVQSFVKFMPRETFLSLLLVFTFFLMADRVYAEAKASDKPDIIFVLLDDLRWDALGYMDHPYVETPNIDRLREQGAMIQNAFVTTSICCPSRATFITGTLANQHGVIDNETSEYNPDVTPPLTKYLQESGYHTAMIGKWHMGKSGAPRDYFDFWLSFKGQGVYNDPLFNINGKKIPHEGYTTDLLTNYALDFIENQPLDQPYFCMLSHKAVHEPFQPAPRHTNAFGAKTVTPEPASWSEDFADKPDWHKRQRSRDVRWHYRTREFESEVLPDAIPIQPWKKNNKYVKQFRCLAAVDDGVGKIIDLLKKRGTLDNTLFVFTSDNGYFHLEHRRWDKRLAYEESLRIPMVVSYPKKINPGTTVTQMITNADFAPTVLDYAGISIPSNMQGLSMRPLFETQKPEWREAVFYEYWKELVHAIPTMTAVRTDRYKLITYPEIKDIDELYDLHKDPYEMNNLALNPKYSKLHKSMQKLMEKERIDNQWSLGVFPHNLKRIRGEEGVLFDLVVDAGAIVDKQQSGTGIYSVATEIKEDSVFFDGKQSAIKVPFQSRMDPAGWPYHVEIELKPESDGVVAVQSTPGYGYKVFIEDGSPGLAVHCKTWVDTTTVIDATESVLNQWTKLQILIDYNQVELRVNGQLVERISLPLPFKGSPKTELVLGNKGKHPVVKGVPNHAFKGLIRNFKCMRGLNL